MKKGDGGTAFPRIDAVETGDYGRQHVISTPGMTLRDYFAGQALTGMLAYPGEVDRASYHEQEQSAAGVAATAYCIADAMIEAREQDILPLD